MKTASWRMFLPKMNFFITTRLLTRPPYPLAVALHLSGSRAVCALCLLGGTQQTRYPLFDRAVLLRACSPARRCSGGPRLLGRIAEVGPLPRRAPPKLGPRPSGAALFQFSACSRRRRGVGSSRRPSVPSFRRRPHQPLFGELQRCRRLRCACHSHRREVRCA